MKGSSAEDPAFVCPSCCRKAARLEPFELDGFGQQGAQGLVEVLDGDALGVLLEGFRKPTVR